MDWNPYFTAAGVAGQSEFIVWQPSAVIGTSLLVGSEDIDLWKDYLRFHLAEHYASVLPKAVSGEDFAFYGTILSGAQQAPDRSRAAIAATNAALGQGVGHVAHLPGQRSNPVLGGGRNVRSVAQDLRYGHDRHARPLSDVFQSDHKLKQVSNARSANSSWRRE